MLTAEKRLILKKKYCAEIRLTINMQRKAPISPEKFSHKLTGLLLKANTSFQRNRHTKGQRIVAKILQCLSVIPLVADAIRYLKTGRSRIFSHTTSSKETVDDMVKLSRSRNWLRVS